MYGSIFRLQIYTREFDRLCAFYGDTLAMAVTEERQTSPEDRVRVFAASGGGEVEVIYAPPGTEVPASNGWNLQVEVDDVDRLHQSLAAAGAAVRQPPQDQFYGHRTLHVLDPSGLELKFFTPLEKEGD